MNLEDLKPFFAYEKLPIVKSPTHTFLIFKENSKYFWFESSWQAYREIHGPFNNHILSVRYVENQLKRSLNWKTVITLEYPKFDYRNMNVYQFGEHILKISNKV